MASIENSIHGHLPGPRGSPVCQLSLTLGVEGRAGGLMLMSVKWGRWHLPSCLFVIQLRVTGLGSNLGSIPGASDSRTLTANPAASPASFGDLAGSPPTPFTHLEFLKSPVPCSLCTPAGHLLTPIFTPSRRPQDSCSREGSWGSWVTLWSAPVLHTGWPGF